MARVTNVTSKAIGLVQLSSELGGAAVGGPADPTQLVSKTIWADNVTQAALDNAITAHVYDPTFGLTLKSTIGLNGIGLLTWTNMPLALTEAPNSRIRVPLYGISFARFTTNVAVAGVAAAILMVRVSIDNGATWTTVPNSPQVQVNTTGYKQSGWVAIPASFQTEVLAAIWGQGGDGVADPAFGLSSIQLA